MYIYGQEMFGSASINDIDVEKRLVEKWCQNIKKPYWRHAWESSYTLHVR